MWDKGCTVDQRTESGRIARAKNRTCTDTVRNGPRKGQECGQPARRGTVPPRCRHHLHGKTAKARAVVLSDLHRWGLEAAVDELADPGETLLRLVTQSSRRVDMYSRMLAEAVEAAERLQSALEHGRVVIADDGEVPGESLEERTHETPFGEYVAPEHPAVQAARHDLDRIFTTGGVAALVGYTFSDTKSGQVYATGEAIRGLAKLEAEERDRCAKFAKAALEAGIAERQVRLAEQSHRLFERLLVGVLDDLDLPDELLDRVPELIEHHADRLAISG